MSTFAQRQGWRERALRARQIWPGAMCASVKDSERGTLVTARLELACHDSVSYEELSRLAVLVETTNINVISSADCAWYPGEADQMIELELRWVPLQGDGT